MIFLAPTVVNIKVTVFWNAMLHSLVDRYHAFGRPAAAIFWVKNMKASLSVTLVLTYHTTQHDNP
jgi:hypothetical protein